MDRDAVVEVIIALFGVAVLAGSIIYIGSTYGNGNITSEGGIMLVGVIAFFIVLMSIIGIFLSRRY
ncbi:MAG: hypothetical protein ACLFNI_02730 [Natronomonas sp.]